MGNKSSAYSGKVQQNDGMETDAEACSMINASTTPVAARSLPIVNQNMKSPVIASGGDETNARKKVKLTANFKPGTKSNPEENIPEHSVTIPGLTEAVTVKQLMSAIVLPPDKLNYNGNSVYICAVEPSSYPVDPEGCILDVDFSRVNYENELTIYNAFDVAISECCDWKSPVYVSPDYQRLFNDFYKEKKTKCPRKKPFIILRNVDSPLITYLLKNKRLDGHLICTLSAVNRFLLSKNIFVCMIGRTNMAHVGGLLVSVSEAEVKQRVFVSEQEILNTGVKKDVIKYVAVPNEGKNIYEQCPGQDCPITSHSLSLDYKNFLICLFDEKPCLAYRMLELLCEKSVNMPDLSTLSFLKHFNDYKPEHVHAILYFFGVLVMDKEKKLKIPNMAFKVNLASILKMSSWVGEAYVEAYISCVRQFQCNKTYVSQFAKCVRHLLIKEPNNHAELQAIMFVPLVNAPGILAGLEVKDSKRGKCDLYIYIKDLQLAIVVEVASGNDDCSKAFEKAKKYKFKQDFFETEPKTYCYLGIYFGYSTNVLEIMCQEFEKSKSISNIINKEYICECSSGKRPMPKTNNSPRVKRKRNSL